MYATYNEKYLFKLGKNAQKPGFSSQRIGWSAVFYAYHYLRVWLLELRIMYL